MKDDLKLINKREIILEQLSLAYEIAYRTVGNSELITEISAVAVRGLLVSSEKEVAENNKSFGFVIKINDFFKNRKAEKSKIDGLSRYRLLKLSGFLFSAKTHKEVFLQLMADWDDEVYEALQKDKTTNLLMINLRYTYAFLAAMWQKSPIGDLIEFVAKIAKG